jgi:LemA protein
MGTGTVVLLVILAIIVFGIFFIVSIYNKLIQLKNRFKNAFAQIDVQLKRRYDLEALEAVIKARNQASSAMERASADPGNTEAIQGLMGAESALTGTLGRLFALAEAYPDLKANQNMMQLSEELTATENKVSFARQAFNDAVMAFNTQREVFPSNIIANTFGFKEAQLFEIKVEAEKEAPKVSF